MPKSSGFLQPRVGDAAPGADVRASVESVSHSAVVSGPQVAGETVSSRQAAGGYSPASRCPFHECSNGACTVNPGRGPGLPSSLPPVASAALWKACTWLSVVAVKASESGECVTASLEKSAKRCSLPGKPSPTAPSSRRPELRALHHRSWKSSSGPRLPATQGRAWT
jgi:hypothetical protein